MARVMMTCGAKVKNSIPTIQSHIQGCTQGCASKKK